MPGAGCYVLTPCPSFLPERRPNLINVGVCVCTQEVKMPQSTIYSCFFYKASHAQELMEDKTAQPTRVEVVKVIQLSAQQFQHFSANLLRDMPFIAANKDLSGYDKGVTRCLLVTTRRNRDGILVDCQGFNYAQYSAYVRDKRSLDLRDVPVDHYDLKPRQPHSQQER